MRGAALRSAWRIAALHSYSKLFWCGSSVGGCTAAAAWHERRASAHASTSAAAALARRAYCPPAAAAAAEAKQQHPHQLPEGVLVVPMPKLSHEMRSGAVSRWLVAEGATVAQYDILFEASTESLVEPAYAVGDFAGRVTLLIEAQEGGVLLRRLAAEGAELPVGAPVALVAEEGSGVEGVAADVAAAWVVPTSDVYDEAQPRVRVLEWQSFLKSGGDAKKGDCGCM